jgi:hypothetical protein
MALRAFFRSAGYDQWHRIKPMSNSSVPQAGRAAPPWRALAWLAALVLAAHALLLQTSPRRDVPAPDPSLRHAPAFVTRRIEMPPPAQVTAAPAVASVKVRPVTKPKQILKEKMAVAKEPRAQSAIDFIANDEPGPIFASDPYASIRLDSEPDPASAAANDAAATTAATAAAEAPLAAASAASADPASAAPPAGPLQTPVTALALPASSRLQYRMDGSAKGLTYHASAELIWHNEGGSYDARMTVSALFLGSRSMASRGQVSADGLAPTRFSDKSRSELAAHFEPDKGRISFSANTPPAPWVRGAQDRLSVFLQLGGLLAGSPASYPVGASISMYTVGRRDADSWTFVVEAGEKLDLPYGELDTLKLSRQPRREFDQKVEIWYAPALGYLPVRSKITQHNGDFVDQQLNTLTPL